MKLKRGFTRFVALVTTISLLLPTAVFALSGAATAAAIASKSAIAASNSSASAEASVITLQAQDLMGLLNGEIGGIPQFGLLAVRGMSDIGGGRYLASKVKTATEAQSDVRYRAVSLPTEDVAGVPNIALAGNAATEILLKADGQASRDLKLTSPSSMPRLIETPFQTLSARQSGAVTIKNLLDRTLAEAPLGSVLKDDGTGAVHRFGTVLTAAKPTVGSSPFGGGWATVVFAQITAELMQRPWDAPEGTITVTPAWAAILLELLLGLAGFAAFARAQRGHSARQSLLVILKREQRE